MQLRSLSNCEPGLKLARSIYHSNGTTLVGAGVTLSQKMLDRLQDLNITSIYVLDEATSDIVVEDIISEETRREAMEVIHSSFQSFREEPQKWRQSFNTQQIGKKVRQVMHSLIDELKMNRSAMNLLGTVCGVDHYVFSHSFNVAIYALAVAMKLGFNERELIEIGIGAMLHDVGKMQIPYELLTKPGKLTNEEYDLIKTHTSLGFELLRKQDEIPLLAAHCAYQHHERNDGSGYPRKLKEDEIHHYAKVVAVCDVFDALTSNRSYRAAMLPHQAIEFLFAGAETHFDKEIVEVFRNTIALYPIGLPVTLSTGEQGVVVDNNIGMPSRPIVRVLRHPNGEFVTSMYEIDLSSRLNLVIAACETIN